MKLYATLENEKYGRKVSKGADKELVMRLFEGNRWIYTVTFKGDTLHVLDVATMATLVEDRKSK